MFFKSVFRNGISKAQLVIITTIYLFLLNLFVNQNLSAWRHMLWPALVFLFLCALFSLLHRYFLKLFLCGMVLISAVCVFIKKYYNIVITEDIILSALTTEADLTLEMASVKIIKFMLLAAGLPIILILWAKIKYTYFYRNICTTLAQCVLCIILIFGILHTSGYQLQERKGHIRDPRLVLDMATFSPLDALYSMYKAHKTFRNMKAVYANVEVLTRKYDYSKEMDDLLVVLVIGESSRGDHFSLNGYSRNTNPLLSRVEHLYSFKHAESCDTLTINSVHCMTSPMQKNQPDRVPRQSSFGEILKHLGFRTEIYSLQTLNGFYKYLHYNKLLTKYTVLNGKNDGAKDSALMPYLNQAIQAYQGGNTLLIAHTLGSHQTYADRISQEHAVFTPYCKNPDVSRCPQQELVNAYDNTIVSVDAMLYQIIKQLENKRAVLIYVSDHGESLGEGGNYFHGLPVNIAPKEQFNIPFIIWFSEKFRATPQGQAYEQSVKEYVAQDKQVSHDFLFHSLLGCAGIRSDKGGIDPRLNLCHMD